MHGSVNVDINVLLDASKRLKQASQSAYNTKTSIIKKYHSIGKSWKDKRYNELGDTIRECAKALDDVIIVIRQGDGFIAGLIKSIQEYEDIRLDDSEINQISGEAFSDSDVSSSDTEMSEADNAKAIVTAGRNWADCLSVNESSAIRYYTGSGHENINSTLRGLGTVFESGNLDSAIAIHEALRRSVLPRECVVYRGASIRALGEFQNMTDEQLVGVQFGERGFMSTSLNSEDAFGGDIRLEITAPAGAHGAYVGYISQCGHAESEVLFDIDQTMVITGVRRDFFGHRIISARILV